MTRLSAAHIRPLPCQLLSSHAPARRGDHNNVRSLSGQLFDIMIIGSTSQADIRTVPHLAGQYLFFLPECRCPAKACSAIWWAASCQQHDTLPPCDWSSMRTRCTVSLACQPTWFLFLIWFIWNTSYSQENTRKSYNDLFPMWSIDDVSVGFTAIFM